MLAASLLLIYPPVFGRGSKLYNPREEDVSIDLTRPRTVYESRGDSGPNVTVTATVREAAILALAAPFFFF